MVQISKYFFTMALFQQLWIDHFNFWKNKDLTDAESVSWSSPSDAT